ncbi:MAG: glycosyl hydrolase family 95 catalytic domain-containing protein [Planctomycetota bacterium]
MSSKSHKLIRTFTFLALFFIYSNAVFAQSSILSVDYRKLISRSDLTYNKQVEHSEAGLPLGNGRMGTVVWTTPSSLKFQINRVDVYANNRNTKSFNKRHKSLVSVVGCDYCGGCGFVDIDFVDFGPDAFDPEDTLQHLSVYDGLVNVKGKGIDTDVFAWHERDVLAVKVSDNRDLPLPISINLRMLRPPSVETKNHLAKSQLQSRDGKIILTQQFTEGDYYCDSAVVIGILGRDSRVKFTNDTEVRLSAESGKGSFTILIASAATFDRNEDVVSSAMKNLDAAAAKGFDRLLESNKKWWHNFWARAFVYLHSDDDIAEKVELHYNYFLYVMASSSRGSLPPKFNGMLCSTEGDRREWGSQHWWNNVSFLYKGMFPANRLELMDPLFDMYSGMYDSFAVAARQQWESKGIFIPEVVWFDGQAELPEDIAREMRDLYLLRKPWDQRSDKFRLFAETKHPQNARWNWKTKDKWIDGLWQFQDRGAGPFGSCVHILSTTSRLPFLYWQRYEFTKDKKWLRDRAYPMLKGAAEFYRNFPHVQKGPDGKYHIDHVNNNEGSWDCFDPMDEVAAMHGIFPVAIRASEILDTDAELRGVWKEFLENLVSLPRSDDPATDAQPEAGVPVYWLNTVTSRYLRKRRRISKRPSIYYDLCTIETKYSDPETFKITSDTFDLTAKKGVSYRMGLASAMLGRADQIEKFLPGSIGLISGSKAREERFFANRFANWEGPQAMTVENLGLAADSLHLALCHAVPPRPGGETIIQIFPAWPKKWDASFTLLCRGAFLVTSSMRKGQIEFVEIKSLDSSKCRMRNPWSGTEVTLYRDGRKLQNINADLLEFDTSKEQNFLIVPKGVEPSGLKRSVL